MKKRQDPEQELQKACVSFLKMQYGENLFYFHCPNGGYRTKAEAGIFKALGVKAGIPDIMILDEVSGLVGTHKGMAIELKAEGKAYNVSDNQRKCLRELDRRSFITLVIDNLEEFVEVVNRAYGHLRKGEKNGKKL